MTGYDDLIFWLDAVLAGYAAHRKKWGWCVVLSLAAVKVAIRIGAT